MQQLLENYIYPINKQYNCAEKYDHKAWRGVLKSKILFILNVNPPVPEYKPILDRKGKGYAFFFQKGTLVDGQGKIQDTCKAAAPLSHIGASLLSNPSICAQLLFRMSRTLPIKRCFHSLFPEHAFMPGLMGKRGRNLGTHHHQLHHRTSHAGSARLIHSDWGLLLSFKLKPKTPLLYRSIEANTTLGSWQPFPFVGNLSLPE